MCIFEEIKSNSFFHVLLSCENKNEFFICDEDRLFFLNLLKIFQSKYCFEIHGYCIMDNHVHLLLKVENSLKNHLLRNISLQYINYFSKNHIAFNNIQNLTYKYESIKNSKEYVCALRFILQNPEKAIVSKIDEYKWSSFSAYFSNSKKFDSNLVTTDIVENIFKSQKCFKEYIMQKSFDDFLELSLTNEEKEIQNLIIWNYLLLRNSAFSGKRMKVV